MALLPVVQLTMVVLGGGMQPVHKLHDTMQVAAYTVPSRLAFESMILLEANAEGQEPWRPKHAAHPAKQRRRQSTISPQKEPPHRGKVSHGVSRHC